LDFAGFCEISSSSSNRWRDSTFPFKKNSMGYIDKAWRLGVFGAIPEINETLLVALPDPHLPVPHIFGTRGLVP